MHPPHEGTGVGDEEGVDVGLTVVGLLVGAEVGARVGDRLGDAVGDTVGVDVGVTVGDKDGAPVGLVEGLDVGLREGFTLGKAVGLDVHSPQRIGHFSRNVVNLQAKSFVWAEAETKFEQISSSFAQQGLMHTPQRSGQRTLTFCARAHEPATSKFESCL